VWQSVVNLIWGPALKRGVAALMVVEASPLGEFLAQVGTAVERMQVKVMVIDGLPRPFNEDVVLVSAAAVHADVDSLVLEDLGETGAGKLVSLIGVEDLRLGVAAYGLLQGLIAEIRVQGIGATPREDFAAVPVHDRHKIHKPTRHWNVGNVSRPHLIGLIDA
jgi:hypothetical protein